MALRLIETLALITCAATATWAPPASAQARFDFATTPGNLPKTVVPSRYRLVLDLDPAKDDFGGSVDIAIEVREPVNTVVLHARGLTASRIELQRGGTSRRLEAAPGPIEQSWALTPTDAQPIAPGRYSLRIDYKGKVNLSGVGLFRADHTVAGQPQRMLATQLESIDARNVFPSFDEPAFRAVFDVTVRAPRGQDVLANMPPLASRARDGGGSGSGAIVTHRFRPTPPMPSYLVAVSVGRYDVLAGSAAGLPLRILTAPGKRAEAVYAMGVTKQVVPYFNAYFGVPYALPKLDQLAVPSTRSGAMEDWGLISYSESSLLFDPAKSSPWTQRGVYNVVAHEIAHQWFGNLVTAASWEEIWLNEAFATWLADKATAHFNPAWHVELESRIPVDRTMAGDAGGATRAIRSGAVDEGRVFDVFDGITYVKGGAVLGMLEQWLGPDRFRAGLAAYMRERKYSNATAGDLWFHMAEASKRDVAAVASSWTDQPGFPLLQAESECSGGQTRLTLSQRRWRDGTSPPSADGLAAIWQVPVRLARGVEQATVLLGSARQTFDLPGCGDAPWVVNAGGVGYYRVEYAAAEADALARQFTRLAAADQVTLLSDAFALAQGGELPMARWLALVARLPEVDGAARATLFGVASAGFAFLDDAMAGTPTQALVRSAGRRVFAPELARLGWAERPGDDAQTRKLRGELIERLADFDDRPTIDEALRRFDADDAGQAPLAPSIRSQVLQAAGMHADRARFDRLMARFKAATGEEDRWVYAAALASGRDEKRAGDVLAASLAGITTPNVAIELPGLVSHRSPFAEQAYRFTVDHWEQLAGLAGDAMFGRHSLLPDAAAGFNDPAQATRLIDDQQKKAGDNGAFPAARTAARIALKSAVREREAAALQKALGDQ